MKFEDLLMQPSDEQQKRLDLEEEVAKLQGLLEMEQEMKRVLRRALHSPQDAYSYRSTLLPLQIRLLVAEVAMMEEEIIRLERKLNELKWCLHHEQRQNQGFRFDQLNFLRGLGTRRKAHRDFEPTPVFQYADISRQRLTRERESSDMTRLHSRKSNGYDRTENGTDRLVARNEEKTNHNVPTEVKNIHDPNKLSEELIKCLISIFLKLNQTPQIACESSQAAPMLAIPCMRSKGFITKTSPPCKTRMLASGENKSRLDPYGILSESDGITRDLGPYRNFIHFTTSSLDTIQISQCLPEMGKLRVLMHELYYVDLSQLKYKQKLAFWINTYNASIMHAFLQHGLPSTCDKLLALMNKAAVNVGGIMLNSLAIEHFILRHPSNSLNSEKEPADEREALLQRAYGLNYPEPNITFALCRGSRSSPALRVYTSEGVVHELEKAKLEYLEASIGVTGKKTIVVPKLLHWHMQDFADNDESLLEWIYSQLPRRGSLKRLIMECLNGDNKISITKKIEVSPYESEFRYLLPL